MAAHKHDRTAVANSTPREGLAAEAADRADDDDGPDWVAAEPDDLVSKLERLAALRDRGAITEMEFGTAKRAMLAEPGRQP